MGTTAQKLQAILDSKEDIRQAINDKGVPVSTGDPLDTYADKINQISGGGSIPVYSNWVVQDENGTKYQIHNGYDWYTNPTPNLSYLPFNEWIINNEATETVVINNAVIVGDKIFNGPNSSFNHSYIPLIRRYGANYVGASIGDLKFNNGFIYLRHVSANNGRVHRHTESDLTFIGQSANYSSIGILSDFAVDNSFIYMVGINGTNITTGAQSNIRKIHEGNFQFVGFSGAYGANIGVININNGNIFIGGRNNATNGVRNLKKYSSATLTLLASATRQYDPSFGVSINTIAFNNGFVYIGGVGQFPSVEKYSEATLAFVQNSAYQSNFGSIFALAIDNGFVYAGGQTTANNQFNKIRKYYESNLVLAGESETFTFPIASIAVSNEFVYVSGGGAPYVRKYNTSDLSFVGSTNEHYGNVIGLNINNGIIYTTSSGGTNAIIETFKETVVDGDIKTLYSIKNKKE
jgi:hypothetical protein